MIRIYLAKDWQDRVRMLTIVKASYIIFWWPLFIVTAFNWSWSWEEARNSIIHKVVLHIFFSHSLVTPVLYMVLHPRLKVISKEIFCCSYESQDTDLMLWFEDS